MSWQPHQDIGGLLSREWLVTNGLGGYSSSTLMNVATRRYHGVLFLICLLREDGPWCSRGWMKK